MSRISTASLHNQVIGSAMQTETAWAAAETQQSTQLVSTDFAGMGTSSRRMLSLEDQISTTTALQAATKNGSSVAQTMYSNIGSMISSLTSLRSQLSSAMTSSSYDGYSNLNTKGLDTLSAIAGNINANSGGAYVFSGSKIDTQPISVDSTASPPTWSYQGDSYVASVQVSSTQTIAYGVTGDNQAFTDALNAAKLAAQASSGTDISSAYQLAQTAITELSNLQETVSSNANTLSDATSTQTSMLSILTENLSNVKDVDTAAVTAKVSSLQTNLQASYSAVASTLKLSLTNYL